MREYAYAYMIYITVFVGRTGIKQFHLFLKQLIVSLSLHAQIQLWKLQDITQHSVNLTITMTMTMT